MQPLLKNVLNQAILETESYETMVHYLESEIELNGKEPQDETPINGVHHLDANHQPHHERPPITTGHCFGCGNPGHQLRNCEKRNRVKRSQNTQNTPCDTCGKNL